MLEPLFDRYFPIAIENRQKRRNKNGKGKLGKLLYNAKRNMNTNSTWTPDLAIPQHRKTSLALKITFDAFFGLDGN